MPMLYLTEQGSTLKKTGDRLIVEKEGEKLLEAPCHQVEGVLIFGNVQFTTQAVHELFQHGIEFAILTMNGKLLGQLTSVSPKNIELRLAQFRRYDDESFTLQLSRALVSGKVRNSLKLLRNYVHNHPDLPIREEIEELDQKERTINEAQNVQELLGIEGISARTYYNAFGKLVFSNFQFDARRRRPPTDPVNSLLSFGYTLAFNEIASLLDGIGFDPYLGYFHKAEYGRPSLAADLLEEFRAPVVDRFTLRLLNNRVLSEQDFYREEEAGGVYLTHSAMKQYFSHYERYMQNEFTHPQTGEKTTFRKCFRIQAQRFANAIKKGEEYRPFIMEA